MISLYAARPPLVRFEQQSVQDQAASLEAGRAIFKNVNIVHVAQPPGKDWTVKNAEKWLEQIKDNMRRENPNAYPPEWVDGFHRAYENWKNGIEGNVPEGETSLRNVPFVTPAEVETYAALYIYSVEAAAAMTEDVIHTAGMGARLFRDKCRAYLEAANKNGKVAEEIAHLKRENENQAAIIKTLEARLAVLEADEPKKRGRPSKIREAA